MKIGIEAQRIFRPKKHGMDMVALELTRNLMQIDHENQYKVFIKSDSDVCLQASSNFDLKVSGGYPYPIWEQAWLPLQTASEKLDILHCTSNTAPLFHKGKLVVTLHDIIYLEKKASELKGSSYQKWGNRYRQLIVPSIIHRADHVITVSEYEKKRIAQALEIPPEKLSVVYNGVGGHFNNRYPSDYYSTIRNTYKLPERFMFFLGNTDPKKNLPNLIKAYALLLQQQVDTPTLLIADFPKEKMLQVLNEHQLPSSLIQKMHFAGYIHQKDLPAFYKLADVFLYPSLRESFGIPILEAMACGTPVLTSNTSSMPEVAGDAAHIIDPTNPEEMSNGMLKLLQDTGYANALINKGFDRASLFTWQNAAKNVLSIYRNL